MANGNDPRLQEPGLIGGGLQAVPGLASRLWARVQESRAKEEAAFGGRSPATSPAEAGTSPAASPAAATQTPQPAARPVEPAALSLAKAEPSPEELRREAQAPELAWLRNLPDRPKTAPAGPDATGFPATLKQEALKAYQAALTPITPADVRKRWLDAQEAAYGPLPAEGRIAWGGDPLARGLFAESQRQENARRAAALGAAGSMLQYAGAYDPQLQKLARFASYNKEGLTATEMAERERQYTRGAVAAGILPTTALPAGRAAPGAELTPEEQLRSSLGDLARPVLSVVGKPTPGAPANAEGVAGMIAKLKERLTPADWLRHRGAILKHIRDTHGPTGMDALMDPGFLGFLGGSLPLWQKAKMHGGARLDALEKARIEVLQAEGMPWGKW